MFASITMNDNNS